MSKLTKSESSRLNGAKSRGAVTPEGRAKSSMNAASHGITSKTLILQNESQDQFLEMLNAYLNHLQPSSQMEIDLITDMVAARWRLRRVWRFETAMLDIEMEAQSDDFGKRFLISDEDMRGGLAFSSLVDKSKGISTILRYDIHLTRTYRKTLDALHILRRLQNDPTEPPKLPLNGENLHLNGAPTQDSDPPNIRKSNLRRPRIYRPGLPIVNQTCYAGVHNFGSPMLS